MRLFQYLFCAAFAVSSASADPAPAGKHILSGDTVAAVPHVSWEQDGRLHTAIGQTAVNQAPATAARYEVKAVTWPTGTLRVLTYKDGGALHPISDETELYVMSGAAEVGVGGQRVSIVAGDAVSRPSGAIQSGKAVGETVILAWSVGSTVRDPKPMVARAADVSAETTAEWLEGGQVMRTATTVETNAKAPPDAVKLISRRYNFDGNSIRVARFVKGGSRQLAKMTSDSLIYVTGGPVRFHQADEVQVVNAGDFIREESGLSHIWDQLSDGGFITTTGIAPDGM